MKTLFFWLVLAVACTHPARAQNTQLVIDQAAVFSSLATPGSGSILDLVEYTDAQGNTYQAGSFSGSVHFGGFAFTGLATDVVVAKRNAAGVYVWAVAGGGAGTQRAKALAVDAAGNVVVTGFFDSATASFGSATLTNARPLNAAATSDVFVARITAGGAWEWAVSAGGGTRVNGDNYANAVAVDLFGNAYVAGNYTSSVAFFGPNIQLATTDPFNAGRETVFIAKLSPSGIWQWARRSEYYGGEVVGVLTDAAANIYFGTQYAGLAQFGSFLLSSPRSSGGTVIAKINDAGTWQWATQAGSSQYARVYGGGMVLGPRGELYMVGAFNGDTATFGLTRLFNRGLMQPPPSGGTPYYRTADAYLARLNTVTGTWAWAIQSHGDGGEYFSTPLGDGAGKLYMGLYTSEPNFQHSPSAPGHQFGNSTVTTVGGSADVIIAKLDTAGAWRWVAQAGGLNNENAAPSYVDGQGRVVISGRFEGNTLPLGPFALAAAPTASYTNYSAFTARLGANGPLAARAGVTAPFAVYPNPAHTNITVAGLRPGQAVQVLDIVGRLVLRGVVPPQGELQLALPAGLASGVYVVRAGAQAQRLVVENTGC